jgi:hypothetical protein
LQAYPYTPPSSTSKCTHDLPTSPASHHRIETARCPQRARRPYTAHPLRATHIHLYGLSRIGFRCALETCYKGHCLGFRVFCSGWECFFEVWGHHWALWARREARVGALGQAKLKEGPCERTQLVGKSQGMPVCQSFGSPASCPRQTSNYGSRRGALCHGGCPGRAFLASLYHSRADVYGRPAAGRTAQVACLARRCILPQRPLTTDQQVKHVRSGCVEKDGRAGQGEKRGRGWSRCKSVPNRACV